MRLPSLPGPRDVWQLLERSADSVDQLLATVPRVVALVGEAERLLAVGPRVVALVAEAERVVAVVPRVVALVDDAERLLVDAGAVIDRIEGTRESAQAVADRTDVVVGRADALLRTLVPLNDRLKRLLDDLQPPLTSLQPVLERLAETTSPAEVDAMVQLVDHLPVIASTVETDIVPVLNTLGTVAPDLHDLLDVSRELNEMLGHVPGLSRIKDRVETQQAANGSG